MASFRKQSYSELVVDFVKHSILSGTLSPGDQVKELIIAQELGISQAPVREGLQMLVLEGLVEFRPNKGKFIVDMTSKQILDSYRAGGVLEGYALARSIHLFSDDDFRKLDDVVESMRDIAANGGDLEKLQKMDTLFHELMFSKTDNELIIELSKRASRGISQFLFFKHWAKMFTPEEIYLRHKKVLDALKSKDPAEIEAHMRQHYEESGERMAQFGSDVDGAE